MTKNLKLGIFDIFFGPGKTAALKNFWKSCSDNNCNDFGYAIESHALDNLLPFIQQYEIATNIEQSLWFDDTGIFKHHNAFSGTTIHDFIEQIKNTLQGIENNTIKRTLIGAVKKVDHNNYKVAAVVIDKADEAELYVALKSWNDLHESLPKEYFDFFHSDDIHEWVLTERQSQKIESIWKLIRPASSLSSRCSINVSVTEDEVFQWIISAARASLALHHRIIPCGTSRSDKLKLEGDYVSYDRKTPLICPPNRLSTASSFLICDQSIFALRLQESVASEKPILNIDSVFLFVFSASDQQSLSLYMQQMLQHLQHGPNISLSQLSEQLSKAPLENYRAAIVASNKAELTEKMEKAFKGMIKSSRSPSRIKRGIEWNTNGRVDVKIAGILPGQGSQSVFMLQELCLKFPAIRQYYDELEERLSSVNHILPSLTFFPPAKGLDQRQRDDLLINLYSQECGNVAVITSSIALSELLSEFGCTPDILIGHSSGEISAKFISGTIQFKTRKELFDTILRVTQKGAEGNIRGEIPKGKYVAVTCSDEAILDTFLRKYQGVVYLAMDNCPQQKVLFMPEEKFQSLYNELTKLGVICITLYFDRAYHTPLFEVEMASIRNVYNSFTYHVPTIPMFSCIKLADFPHDPEMIKNWAELNWTNCVNFKDACHIVYERGFNLFIEIGPGGTLSGFVDNVLNNQPHKALPFDREGGNAYENFLQILATLFVEGVPVTLDKLFSEIPEKDKLILERIAPPPVFAPVPDNLPLEYPTLAPFKLQPNKDAKAFILGQHFDLMNEFLQMESALFETVLQSSSALRSGRPIFSEAHTVAAPDKVRVLDLPLIDRIVHRDDIHCIAERIISRKKDLFLGHHTLGRFNIKKPNNEAPLPIVPLAMTIEIMAEAASLMASPHYFITEIANLHALRWMTVDAETLPLTIECRLLNSVNPEEVRTLVTVASKEEADKPYCDAVVILRPTQPSPPSPMPFEAPVPTSSLWDADSFFEQCLFHGEAFSCMDKLLGLGEDTIEIALSMPRNDFLIEALPTPVFKLPAQLLDVPGHASAWWKVEKGDAEFGLFPVYIDRLQFFEPSPQPHTEFIGRCKNKVMGALMESDFEILGKDQTVFAKISGMKMIYYKFETSFLRGHYWTGPNTYYANEVAIDHPGILAMQAELLAGDFFRQSGGLFLNSLLCMYLNEVEKEQFSALPKINTRREQWLLGRIAAKDVVRKWAMNWHGVYILSPSIEITTTPEGKPFVVCQELERLGPLPNISITHTGPSALAIAVGPGYSAGVDLESFPEGLAHPTTEPYNRIGIAFSDAELKYLESKNADLNALFTAKEAASKAIGIGFLNSIRAWSILSFDDTSAVVGVQGETIEVNIQRNKYQILSYCCIPIQTAEQIKAKLTLNVSESR